jgi:hypothetical protein
MEQLVVYATIAHALTSLRKTLLTYETWA